MLGKLGGLVISALLLLAIVAGGPGVWWYDRHFTGYNFSGVPIVHWFSFSLKPGPGVQLADLKAAEASAAAHSRAVAAKQASATTQIAQADKTAQAAIQWRTQTLIQKVPTYVTREAVAACTVPVGFIRLFNAGARGVDVSIVPPPAGQSDDGPSGIGLDTVASVTLANDGVALANAQQLTDLQTWVRAMQAAQAPP